jgi:Tfp pilus assembly protein PilF
VNVLRLVSSMAAMAVMVVLLNGCATTEEAKQKSKGYYQEGMASLEKDRQKAFVSFQKAVQLDPDNKDARYGLGHLLVYQGKLSQAEVEFREAIRIDENYSEAHTYLGQVLAGQDRWPEAIAEYRRALSNPLYTTPDLARFHLGKVLAHEKDYQGAMEALEDALAVNPPNVPPAMLHAGRKRR